MSLLRKITRAWLCGLWLLISVPVLAGPILVLKGPNSGPYKEALSGFRRAYSGGIEVEHGRIEQVLTQFPTTDPPSLIVAIGRASAETAHQKCPAVPLVFVLVPDPSAAGLTGTNIGGISMEVPGDVQLAHFKELLPDPKKLVAIVYNPVSSRSVIAEAQKAAPGLSLVLEQVPVESAEQVRGRIELIKPLIGAIWVVPDESFATGRRANKWFAFLESETRALHVPLFMTMNPGSTFVQEGALAAVVSDFFSMGRQCGELVAQIAAGKAKVQKIGIQPPVDVRWELNLKTAGKIGLALPSAVLKSAKTYR